MNRTALFITATMAALVLFVGCDSGTQPTQAVGLGISSINPASGPSSGGTTVTVTGQNFTPGVGVRFGSAVVQTVQVVNSSTLMVVTPAHPAGTVDVVVSSGGRSAGLTGAYTFTN